jgi:hypothetical protein
MEITIYFSHSFVNESSPIYKITGNDALASVNEKTTTTALDMIKTGWRLSHAIKTSQSAQLESFNFLLIFEK